MAHYELQPSVELPLDDLQARGWDTFRVIVGPAAGPRNFATLGLDRHLLQHSAARSKQGTEDTRPTWLTGGSFAALRHCALVTSSIQQASGRVTAGTSATEELMHAFAQMTYQPGDTSETLASYMEDLYHIVAPDPKAVVNHPHFRLAIFVTATHPWTHSLPDWLLQTVFYGLLAANVVSESVLHTLQHRLCFYSGPEPPPFVDQQAVTCVPLTPDNLHQVLHATTCVPFYSQKCTYIEGVGEGNYMDGALGDYVLNFTASQPDMPVLVLAMECHGAPLKRTIWDTFVPWRYATAEQLRHVSVLSPTTHYRDQLPAKALPSTWDFFKADYIRHPHKRINSWLAAYRLSLQGIPDHPASLLTTPPPPPPTHTQRATSSTSPHPTATRRSQPAPGHQAPLGGACNADAALVVVTNTAGPDTAAGKQQHGTCVVQVHVDAVCEDEGSSTLHSEVPQRTWGQWLKGTVQSVWRPLRGDSAGYAPVAAQAPWPDSAHKPHAMRSGSGGIVNGRVRRSVDGHVLRTWPLHDLADAGSPHWHGSHVGTKEGC